MADNKSYWLVTRKTPGACRSARLRLAGVRPPEAYGLNYRMPAHEDGAGDGSAVVWDYTPGNTRDTAVTVERGQWESGAGPYLCKSYNPATTLYEWHTAWNLACRWRCAYDGTAAEPWPNSGAWRFSDFFPTLEVVIEVVANDDHTWDITPHVYTRQRDEEIIPHSSIPAVSSWVKESEDADQDPGDAESDRAFNARFAAGADALHLTEDMLGVERNDAGELTHAPGIVELTFRKRMTTSGAHLSVLVDSANSELADADGDFLYTVEGSAYLTDHNGDVLVDSANSPLFTDEGEDVAGTVEEVMEISGTCYIQITQ